jgi:lipopolysaccharide/colanic/teichoic acid biosynthesis glycosyltransferase
MDVVGSAVALALLSPALAATAIAIAAIDGRPVLFRQVRPGLRGRPFRIVKFRTMRPLRPGEPLYWSDNVRVTRLGRFLRAASIDELPELWNVLLGDMSLVGPRPLLIEYLETYSPDERRRHDVRPGITGWAAVNGRHVLKFHDRLTLDVWYAEHWSLALDLRILALTIHQVLRRRDVEVTQDAAAIGAPIPPRAPERAREYAD